MVNLNFITKQLKSAVMGLAMAGVVTVGGAGLSASALASTSVEEFKPLPIRAMDVDYIETRETLMAFEAFNLSRVDNQSDTVEFILDNSMNFSDKLEYFFSGNSDYSTLIFRSPTQNDAKTIDAATATCPKVRLEDISFIGFQKIKLDKPGNHHGARVVTKISPELISKVKDAGCLGINKMPTDVAKGLDKGSAYTTIYGLEYKKNTAEAQAAAEKYFKDKNLKTALVDLPVVLGELDLKAQKNVTSGYNQ